METSVEKIQSLKPEPPRAPVSLGFKVILWWGFVALIGTPVHVLPDWMAWTLSGVCAWLVLVGTIGIVVFHALTRALPMPRWMRESHGIVVDADASSQGLFCMDCGYDLRGIGSARCPECGWTIDRDLLSRSHLSWAYRAEIGRWRAYWRTAWLATRWVKRLSMEVVRPVNPRDAAKFATLTALLASVPLAMAVLGLIWSDGPNVLNPIPSANRWGRWGGTPFFHYEQVLMPYVAGVTLTPVVPVGILLMMWLITRSGAIWFAYGAAPQERKERAAALSRYTMAPLAWTPAMVALIAVSVAMGASPDFEDQQLMLLWVSMTFLGAGLWAICWLLCWINTLALLWRANRPGEQWMLTAAMALPVTWAGCAVIALGVMPWVAGYLWLMIDSLR